MVHDRLSFHILFLLRGDLSHAKSSKLDDGVFLFGYQWSEEELGKVVKKTISMNQRASRQGEILAKHYRWEPIEIQNDRPVVGLHCWNVTWVRPRSPRSNWNGNWRHQRRMRDAPKAEVTSSARSIHLQAELRGSLSQRESLSKFHYLAAEIHDAVKFAFLQHNLINK